MATNGRDVVAGENIQVSSGRDSAKEVRLNPDPRLNGITLRGDKPPAPRPPGALSLYVQGGALQLTQADGSIDAIVINRTITSTRSGPLNGQIFVIQHDWEKEFLLP